MAGEDVEVGVGVQEGGAGTDGLGGDEAVDQLADGLALVAAGAEQASRLLEVGGFRWDDRGAGQEAPQLAQVGLVAGAGQDLHADGVAGGDVPSEQVIDPLAGGAPGSAQELDPRGRVDQDHSVPLERILSRSPSQPEPRRRRASSSPSGSAATARRAKLTASRLVESW